MKKRKKFVGQCIIRTRFLTRNRSNKKEEYVTSEIGSMTVVALLIKETRKIQVVWKLISPFFGFKLIDTCCRSCSSLGVGTLFTVVGEVVVLLVFVVS